MQTPASKGVAMSTLIVTIQDHIRHTRIRLELSTDREVEYLINDLIYWFGLPRFDVLGRPLKYDLMRAWNRTRLNPEHTLGRIGIRPEEHLELKNPLARWLWPWIKRLLRRLQDAVVGELWDQAADALRKLKLLGVESDPLDALEKKIPVKYIREAARPGPVIVAEAVLNTPAGIVGGAIGVGVLVVAGGAAVAAGNAVLAPPPAPADPWATITAVLRQEVPIAIESLTPTPTASPTPAITPSPTPTLRPDEPTPRPVTVTPTASPTRTLTPTTAILTTAAPTTAVPTTALPDVPPQLDQLWLDPGGAYYGPGAPGWISTVRADFVENGSPITSALVNFRYCDSPSLCSETFSRIMDRVNDYYYTEPIDHGDYPVEATLGKDGGTFQFWVIADNASGRNLSSQIEERYINYLGTNPFVTP